MTCFINDHTIQHIMIVLKYTNWIRTVPKMVQMDKLCLFCHLWCRQWEQVSAMLFLAEIWKWWERQARRMREREKERECVRAEHSKTQFQFIFSCSLQIMHYIGHKHKTRAGGVRCGEGNLSPSHLVWIWCHQMHRKIVASDKTSNADTVFQTHRTTGWCFHCSCVLWSTCRLVGPGDSGSLEISSLTRNWKDYKWNPVRILSKWLWNAKQAKQETWQNNDRWNGK